MTLLPEISSAGKHDRGKTKEELIRELAALRRRLAEFEALDEERRRLKQTLRKAYDELEEQIEERTFELVRANEQLRQEKPERIRTEAELQHLKEYLENVLNNSVDAIGIVDRQGKFILWNRRAVEIYGYQFEELTDKTAFELYADADELNRMLARLHQDGVVREYEITMQKKDGSVVPMDISIASLKTKALPSAASALPGTFPSEKKMSRN